MALPNWALGMQSQEVPLTKQPSCRGCPLEAMGAGWVPADGEGPILLVGEAPGADEAKSGKPFVGASGQYLDRLLARAGIDRSLFTVHNVLSCRPPDNKLAGMPWHQGAIAHCRPNLDQTIARVKPKVIVAMGNTPLKRLTGFEKISRTRGYVLDGPDGIWVVPTFHPSHLLPRRGQPSQAKFFGTVIHDLKKALTIHDRGFARQAGRYLCDPPLDVASRFYAEYAEALKQNPLTKLSFDIETPYKMEVGDESELIRDEEEDDEESTEAAAPKFSIAEKILRISFAFREGYSMSVPFEEPYLGVIRLFLNGDGLGIRQRPLVVWNGEQFDIPVLREHGYHVDGRVYDYMWGWHLHQSDLPRGLESVGSYFWPGVPWKHEAQRNPAWYSAVDSDVALWNANGIERELKANGQWGLFERHIVDLGPILRTAGGNGVHIDTVAQRELESDLEQELAGLNRRALELVDKGLWPRKLYKKLPKVIEGREFERTTIQGKVKVCSKCGAREITKASHITRGGRANPCRDALVEVHSDLVPAWREILPFNLGSRDQFLKWVRSVGHAPGEDPKTGRTSVGKKWLQEQVARWGSQFPLYGVKVRYQGVVKTLSVYVRGFKPDQRGLVYGTYSHAPSTGRLSQHSVNLTNVSHRGTALFADRVRATIVPGEGYAFVEADSSAIEAVMTGYFMGSEEYIARAKKGIHDYMVTWEKGVEFNDENIARSKGEWKADRDRNKQGIHGTSYGMGWKLLQKTYPESFPTQGSAKRWQENFFLACAGLKDWQHRVRTEAHKATHLVNPWGYRHYYYDVFKRGRDGATTLGEDGKRAVAFLPQSSAAAFLKDNALRVAARVPAEWLPANFLIHDSMCLRVPVDRIDEAVNILCEVMTREIPELNGLRVGCEVKVGTVSWAEMQKVKEVRV